MNGPGRVVDSFVAHAIRRLVVTVGGISLAKKDGQIIHEGPMADTRGTGWRADAAKLEALRQERIENPMKTPPNSLTSVDKAQAARTKSDEGSFDKTDLELEGKDTLSVEE
jgi:hypothetical protein